MREVIDTYGLGERDINFLKEMADRLREKRIGQEDTGEVDGLKLSAGAWRGLIDAEEFKQKIYESRSILSTRPEVKL